MVKAGLLDKTVPGNLKAHPFNAERPVPDNLVNKRIWLGLVQYVVYIVVLLSTTFYYHSVTTEETRFSPTILEGGGWGCQPSGTAQGKETFEINLGKVANAPEDVKLKCAVLYSFLWTDIVSEETRATKDFPQCKRALDFRTVAGQSDEPTVLTYTLAVSQTKANILVGAPSDAGSDFLFEDYLAEYDLMEYEAEYQAEWEALNPEVELDGAEGSLPGTPVRRQMQEVEREGLLGNLPEPGPKRRAGPRKEAVKARRRREMAEGEESEVMMLAALTFNTLDVEGIDVRCTTRASLPKRIDKWVMDNQNADWAIDGWRSLNIGWDIMVSGQCYSDQTSCASNDQLKYYGVYVKYFKPSGPGEDGVFGGEWVGYEKILDLPAVFTPWGEGMEPLFNISDVCGEITPPGPFNCKRKRNKNWLEAFTLGFSIAATAFTVLAVATAGVLESLLDRYDAIKEQRRDAVTPAEHGDRPDRETRQADGV